MVGRNLGGNLLDGFLHLVAGEVVEFGDPNIADVAVFNAVADRPHFDDLARQRFLDRLRASLARWISSLTELPGVPRNLVTTSLSGNPSTT